MAKRIVVFFVLLALSANLWSSLRDAYTVVDPSSLELVLEKSKSTNRSHEKQSSQLHSSSSSLLSLPTLVITGTAQDVGKYVNDIEKNLRRLLRDDFDLVEMVFFENDSTDNTVDKLQQWNRNGWNVTVLSRPGLNTKFPDRTVRLAHGRNELWKYIQSKYHNNMEEGSLTSSTVDFVLMMDMDDMTVHLAHVTECFNLPQGWDGCCTNSYWWYYDLWALRTYDDWTDCDFRYDCPNVQSSNRKLKNDVTWNRMKHLPASLDPIPVRSCFGGAVLYNYDSLSNHNLSVYRGTYDDGSEREICEHVPFHNSLLRQKKDFKLFLQPKMLTDGKTGISHRKTKMRLEAAAKKSHLDPSLNTFYRTMDNFE